MRCRSRVHLICQRGVGESLTQAIDGTLRTGDSSLVRPMTPLPELSRHVPLAGAPLKVTR